MHKRIILNDLALDLNISPSDIIHMFKANGDYRKTALSSLTTDEANRLLKKITRDNMVENFDDFFACKYDIRKGKLKICTNDYTLERWLKAWLLL